MVRWIIGLTLAVLLFPAPYAFPQKRAMTLEEQVSEADLKTTVEKLVSFGTRSSFSTRGVGEARDWIKSELEKTAKKSRATMEVAFHEFTDPRLRRGDKLVAQKNVYAALKGRKYPNQVIVFGAHYDSVNSRDRNPDAFAPGANDNASGTAAVLEAARILSREEHDRTIIFVAFASEEQGLIGSWHFGKFLKDSGFEVVAMLNNDIVGGAKDDQGKPLNSNDIRCFSEGPQDSPSRRLARLAKLVIENRLKDFTVLLQERTDRPGRGGDHMSFNRHGFSAIRLIETRETDWHQHTPNDVPERVHFPYHALAVKADLALLANLASAPQPPDPPELTLIEGGLRVSWKTIDGAKSYRVGIRRGGLEFHRPLQSNTTSLIWQEPFEGEIQVSLAAVNDRGHTSLFSPEAKIDTSHRVRETSR